MNNLGLIFYDLYQKVFITTGNGMFFAFPIMILGGVLYKYREIPPRPITYCLGVWGMIAYFVEIGFLNIKSGGSSDGFEMIYSMPLFIYFLIYFILQLQKNAKIKVNGKKLRKWSSAIYLMQYGIIFVVNRGLNIINLSRYNYANLYFAIMYISVILIPIVMVIILPQKVQKAIF